MYISKNLFNFKQFVTTECHIIPFVLTPAMQSGDRDCFQNFQKCVFEPKYNDKIFN